jgi:hypothetical protein
MSTIQGGPGNIVTNGLVLYLDAANPNSYVSGSTTWNDISSGGNNGTLINGPTYSSVNGGSIVFDGIDDYVTNVGTTSTFSFIQNTAVFTLNVWVKPSILGTAMYFMGNNDGTAGSKGFYFGKLANNRLALVVTYGVGGQFVINYQPSNYFTDTNWVNVTVSSNGSNATAYKNGVQFGSLSSTIINFSTGDSQRTLAVGRVNNLGSNWSGNVAITQIYNRALSASEDLHNFNTARARFGSFMNGHQGKDAAG